MIQENPYQAPRFVTAQPPSYPVVNRFLASATCALVPILVGSFVGFVYAASTAKNYGNIPFAAEMTNAAIVVGVLAPICAIATWLFKWWYSLPWKLVLHDTILALAVELAFMALVILSCRNKDSRRPHDPPRTNVSHVLRLGYNRGFTPPQARTER